jgi:hypothetical protein
MSLSYKPNQNLAITTKACSESRKKQKSITIPNHFKKITFHECPSSPINALPRFNRSNLFYNRNPSLKKHQIQMIETNDTTFYRPPKKIVNRLNSSHSKISENNNKSLKKIKPLLSAHRVCSEELPKCYTYEDEPIEPAQEKLKEIAEENNVTDVLPTEFSEVVVQELPCPKLFNNPKITKKISIESNHENSTRTSSAYFGGKLLPNYEFSYEKSVMRDMNLFIVTNKDTG